MTISAVPVAGRRRAVRWRTVVGFALSLAVHALLLFSFRENLELPGVENEKERAPLIVEFGPPSQASRSSQPAQQAQPAQPAVTPAPPSPPSARRAPRTPSAHSTEVPVARAPQPARPPLPEAQSAPPDDLSAMIAARRAQREARDTPAPPREAAPAVQGNAQGNAQGNEIALENIQRSLKQGRGREGTNGLFRILHKGPRSASFSFRGWSTDSSKHWNQVIEVDAGPNGDVEHAIVRRMIELIRQHHQEDFYWDSHRLGRIVKLSARKEDGAGLEEFLMHEFFDNG